MATKKDTAETKKKTVAAKESTAKRKATAAKKEADTQKESAPKKSGKFEKGRKKTGGRQKGTQNKLTTDLRKLLQEQLTDHINHIGETIAAIDKPADKAAALATWTQYLIPKYSNTTINADTKRDIATEDYIKQLADKYDGKDISIDITKIQIVDNG